MRPEGKANPAPRDPDAEPEEPLRGLYFVRVPKPELGDETAVQRLQQEFEMQLTTVQLLTETRKMKRLEKSEARDSTRKALDDLRGARDLCKGKEDLLRPFWQSDKKNREDKNALRNTRSELDAETEAELDKKIADVEYSLEHESHALSVEKAMLQQIKRLKAQRADVRKYEASHSHLQERRMVTEEERASKDVLERELKVLRDEKKQCERVVDELKAVEDKIGADVAKIEKEVEDAIAEKRRKHEKLKEARAARKGKLADFNQNRDFSRKVRGMVGEGRIEEAQAMCAEYTEKMLHRLNTDPEYRNNYCKLWATQKKGAVSMAGVSDADLGIDNKKRRGKNAPSGSILDIPLKPGQTKADAVIARALAEAQAELEGSKGVEEQTVGMDAMSTKPVKKPVRKEEAGPRGKDIGRLLVAEDKLKAVVAEEEDDFELPQAIRVKEEPSAKVEVPTAAKPVDSEALQKRKERRKAQADKRRQRAIEQNKAREEERLRLKEEAEGRLAAKREQDRQRAKAEDEAEAEESGAAGGDVPVPTGVKNRKLPSGVQAKKVDAHVRRPLPRKRRQGVKGAVQAVTDAFQKHQTSIAVGSFLAIMLAMLLMWFLQ